MLDFLLLTDYNKKYDKNHEFITEFQILLAHLTIFFRRFLLTLIKELRNESDNFNRSKS